ncbi:MAG TPA: hypothetical protein VMU95_01325, partial [Trebonia sp.]|nr:hypothetical protein [Trebonia sp.]
MAIENPFKGMPKWAIWASLAGGTAVTGYALWRHHQTTGSWSPFATSTTASASSQDTDPVTGLPYSQDNATDPLTGLTYLAEAEQYGSVQAAEASVSQFGATVTSGNGTTTTAYGTPGTTTTASGGVSASTYTSNAAWSQSVQAGLTDIGYNPTDVASALGLYLTGQPLTAAQAQIVNAA